MAGSLAPRSVAALARQLGAAVPGVGVDVARLYLRLSRAGWPAPAALTMARAHVAAELAGCTWEWRDDVDGCAGCDCGYRGCPCASGRPHEVEACYLMAGELELGERPDVRRPDCLASLHGICGADDAYRLAVESELAHEARGRLEWLHAAEVD